VIIIWALGVWLYRWHETEDKPANKLSELQELLREPAHRVTEETYFFVVVVFFFEKSFLWPYTSFERHLFPNCLQGTVKCSREHWFLSWFRLRHSLKANLRIINKQKKLYKHFVLWWSTGCLQHYKINKNIIISLVSVNQPEQLWRCNEVTLTKHKMSAPFSRNLNWIFALLNRMHNVSNLQNIIFFSYSRNFKQF